MNQHSLFDMTKVGLKCYPFLRWAGGKRRWIRQLKWFMPERIEGAYWEPFLGGGAVFWHLAAVNKLTPGRVFLSDLHPALIDLWLSVRDCPEDLIGRIHAHIAEDTKEVYLKASRLPPEGGVERGAWLWWMAQGAFQGICKFNRKGHCVGSYGDGLYPDPAGNMRDCHAELTRLRVLIKNAAYERIRPQRGDFVYFDPPYYGAHGYTQDHFPDDAHAGLKALIDRLSDDGVKVALSNSPEPFIKELYADYHQHDIWVMYTMGDSDFRRKTELLVTNYQTDGMWRRGSPEVMELGNRQLSF